MMGSLDLGAVFAGTLAQNMQQVSAQIVNDLVSESRAHNRFMHMMDRGFLQDALSEQNPLPQSLAGLSTASHTPYAQPWASPVRPVGT